MSHILKTKEQKRERRHKRARAKICGTPEMPRLCVFRSNKYVYAQIINDEKGSTLAHSSSKTLKIKEKGIVAAAKEVGRDIARKAISKKISNVVFDRGGYIYTGAVKALAESARASGLKF